MPLAKDVDLYELAKITKGATGADIKIICTEAAIHSIKNGRYIVEMKDFMYAINKVLKNRFRPYANYGFAPNQGMAPNDQYHV
jgi:proteasome regulatory subunit